MKWLLIVCVVLSGCATKKISVKEDIQEHRKVDSVAVKEDIQRIWIDTTRMSATRVKVTKVEFYEPDMYLKDVRVGALKSVEVMEYEHESKDSGMSEVENVKRDSVVVRDSLDRKVDRKVKESKRWGSWWRLMLVVGVLMFLVWLFRRMI